MTADELAAQLLETLRRCSPEEVPTRMTLLGEGDFSTAFLLDDRVVARVGKHAEADVALAREARLLLRLAPLLPLPVPAPRVLPVRTPSGNVVAVHRQIAGTELLPERWSAMPEPARSRCAQQLGAFLSQLHAVDPELAHSAGAETADYRAEAGALRKRLRRLGAALLPPSLARRTEAVLAWYEAGGPLWSFRPALVHADLSPDHVLLMPDATALAGIIDWADARIGDPARDFVYLYEDWGAAFLDAVLGHYAREPADRLMPRIHLHFVIAHLDWMIDAARAATSSDLSTGALALERALDDLELDLAGADS